MRLTKTFPLLLILFSLSLSSFAQQRETVKKQRTMSTEKATFGSGCFWCTEAIFQQVKGVHTAQSGYMGGKTQNPTYKDICTGLTGHAEVVQIVFNPEVVSFDELLEIFWKTHDPTTLNRQGNDVGTQYRSAVFYHTDEQKNKAEAYKFKLDNAKIWDNPIVTEITPASQFYIAEDYHQDYYNNNANKNPYCSMVITPKIEKFKKIFEDKLAK
jgi:peptide-methionine (S)-S-oxide reductase